MRFLARRKKYIKARYREIMEEIREENAIHDFELSSDDTGESSDDKLLLERILRGDHQFIL